LAFLAFVAVFVWQQWRARRLTAEAVALREEGGQAATLRGENERLARQLKVVVERSQVEASELPRLRGQAARARELEQENARLKADRDRLVKAAKSSAAEAPEPAAPETPERKLQRVKGFFGRDLGMAVIRAAAANGGNVPTE